jgi:hypothetical protein
MQEFTTDSIKANTFKLIQPMAMEKMKDTVLSIGSIMCCFKDNISIKDKYYLAIAQAIIANLDLNFQQNALRAQYEEIKDGEK